MSIFEFDPQAAARIQKVVEEHPMSLDNCADALEMVAPLYTLYTARGFTMIMNMILSDPELFRRTAAEYQKDMNQKVRDLWERGNT